MYILTTIYTYSSVFTIESAQHLVTTQFEQFKPSLKKTVHSKFSDHANGVLFTVNQLRQEFTSLNMRFVFVYFTSNSHSLCNYNLSEKIIFLSILFGSR